MAYENLAELRNLAACLRTLDCEHPDITILGHDLARRIERHLEQSVQPTPSRTRRSAMPRFFLATAT